MIKNKPSCSPEVNESENFTIKTNGQASKTKRNKGKKMWTKTEGTELKAETKFKVQCSDLEGYIFYIEPRVSETVASKIKHLEHYFGATYSNICKKAIVTKTMDTFLNPDIPTIIPDTGVKCPNTDVEMTYLKKKNIDEDICHKTRKKCLDEINMHKIYNVIVVQTKK